MVCHLLPFCQSRAEYLVPDCVFVPSWWVCSLISSSKDLSTGDFKYLIRNWPEVWVPSGGEGNTGQATWQYITVFSFILSVESQKGAIKIQRYSLEYKKGDIAVQRLWWQRPSASQWNTFALNWRYVSGSLFELQSWDALLALRIWCRKIL